jgi:hypothetical protein
MVINKEIFEIFKEFQIDKDEGLLYLLSLYFNVNSNLFSNEFVEKICTTGIFYQDSSGLNWSITLFENQENAWSWIKEEYIPLFKNANKDRGGNHRDCLTRFKKLFSKYPDIRKQEVIEATRLYISEKDPAFIRNSHYFIEKGVGANKSSDLLEYIDRYREGLQNQSPSQTLNTILQ